MAIIKQLTDNQDDVKIFPVTDEKAVIARGTTLYEHLNTLVTNSEVEAFINDSENKLQNNINLLQDYCDETFLTKDSINIDFDKYITDDEINIILSDYLPNSGGVVSGNITAPKFIGALEGNALSASKLSQIGVPPESLDRGTIAYSRFDYFEDVVGLPKGDNANGVLTINTHEGPYNHQLGFSASGFFYRKVYDKGINTSGDWNTILHSGNYSDYALPITGGTINGGLTVNGNWSSGGYITAWHNTPDLSSLTADASLTTSWNIPANTNLTLRSNNNTLSVVVDSVINARRAMIQVGHFDPSYSQYLGQMLLNPFGGNVAIGGTTADEKLHVHGNILATGDITVRNVIASGSIVGGKPLHEFNESTISIDPNIYYRLTSAQASLTISLNSPSNTNIMNEYFIEFPCGGSVTLPTLTWVNGTAPTFESGKTYQISIVNNLALCASFS